MTVMKTLLIRKYIVGYIIIGIVNLSACKKMLNVDPPIDQYTSESVYSKTPTAVYAMTGVYESLAGYEGPMSRGSLIYGLLADELEDKDAVVFGGSSDRTEAYKNSENSIEVTSFAWDGTYRNIIYRCNAVIEGVLASSSIPDHSKSILIGEAKFVRALMYFYLVNLYGDVPLILSTDYKENSNKGRTAVGSVYEQIITDLKQAQENLSEEYLDVDLSTPTIERVRPNKAAATALLARVYLYLQRWADAETEASKIIENSASYDLVPLNEVFLKNNREAIWQLQPDPNRNDGTQKNTMQAELFIPNHNDPNANVYFMPDVFLSPFLISSFEAEDQRKTNWILNLQTVDGNSYPIPFKYKVAKTTGVPTVQTEYTTIFRLAELLLIRAEARAKQGKIIGANSAQSDLNKIRLRAGLAETNASSEAKMLDAIDQERYVELFTEFGHRWLNMKHRGTINARMAVVTEYKGGNWQPEKSFLGIPYDEFKFNSALVGHQNPGYREIK